MYETAGYDDGAYLYYGLRCDTMQLVDMAQSFGRNCWLYLLCRTCNILYPESHLLTEGWTTCSYQEYYFEETWDAHCVVPL